MFPRRLKRKVFSARGFTLVELLVVVALIAVLASLLLPALVRARAAAQSIRCQSNAKQLSLAMLMYVSETAHYPVRGWMMTLFLDAANNRPRSTDLAFCPSDRLLLPKYAPGPLLPSNQIGYGQNFYGMSDGGGLLGSLGLGGVYVPQSDPTRVVLVPQPESAVLAPSDMIALGDGIGECRGQLYRTIQQELGFNFQALAAIKDVDSEKLARARHRSHANIAFADGHLEKLPFKTLFAETEDAFRRWNADHLPHPELRIPGSAASSPQ